MPTAMQTLIDRALAVREPLRTGADTTCLRLFNGRADGIDGLVIEQWADVLTAQIHEGRLKLPMTEVRAVCLELHRRLGARAVYRKWFVRDRSRPAPEQSAEHTRAQPWIGDPVEPELAVLENGLTFLIRPYDGYSVGLFLEHRRTRRRLRELAGGRRVLNTFAYTCGFSVAAAAGQAASTDSVDLHRRYLEWGKRNFAANGLAFAGHTFFASDVFDFFKRARRQGRRYDLIVLDPPTFARARRPARSFVLDERLEDLVAQAVGLLDPGGTVLLSTNDRGITSERLAQALTSPVTGRTCTSLEPLELPEDFAGDPAYAKTILAVYA
ncbi:MAG: class I SAM-dependent rRNA methyltransferase [Phycisphaerae bacterium]|jgi:23S rRNA (cytosine1962-C5)-methyltransferase